MHNAKKKLEAKLTREKWENLLKQKDCTLEELTAVSGQAKSTITKQLPNRHHICRWKGIPYEGEKKGEARIRWFAIWRFGVGNNAKRPTIATMNDEPKEEYGLAPSGHQVHDFWINPERPVLRHLERTGVVYQKEW